MREGLHLGEAQGSLIKDLAFKLSPEGSSWARQKGGEERCRQQALRVRGPKAGGRRVHPKSRDGCGEAGQAGVLSFRAVRSMEGLETGEQPEPVSISVQLLGCQRVWKGGAESQGQGGLCKEAACNQYPSQEDAPGSQEEPHVQRPAGTSVGEQGGTVRGSQDQECHGLR